MCIDGLVNIHEFLLHTRSYVTYSCLQNQTIHSHISYVPRIPYAYLQNTNAKLLFKKLDLPVAHEPEAYVLYASKNQTRFALSSSPQRLRTLTSRRRCPWTHLQVPLRLINANLLSLSRCLLKWPGLV